MRASRQDNRHPARISRQPADLEVFDGPIGCPTRARAGLLLGVTAEILFDGPAFGMNVSIGIVTLLAAGWLVRRRDGSDPLDAWLPVAAVVCAFLVAVSGDRFLALVDTVCALAFAGAR